MTTNPCGLCAACFLRGGLWNPAAILLEGTGYCLPCVQAAEQANALPIALLQVLADARPVAVR